MFTHTGRLGLVAIAATAALSSPSFGETVRLTAGVAVNFEGMLPALVAEQEGLLEEAGIEIEFLDFQGGGPTVQAFVGDSIDICYCAGDHAVRLINRNIPTVILYNHDNRHNYTLIGRDDLVNGGDLGDLAGQNIGITSPGSMTDNTLRWAIRELDMDPDADYQLAGSGTGASMIASIENGLVSAGMLVGVDTEFLLQRGGFSVVENFTELPYAGFSTLVKRDWLEANPEVAAAYVDALDRAVDILKSDPEVAYEIVREMYPSLSDELIAFAVEDAINRIPEHGLITQTDLDTVNGILMTAEPDLREVTLEEILP